ncbi:hypothetical protein BC941DRAFT_466154 [Chlamydoabsidia padenii]|nr:hypothetical protein BC941DRAFT_466154 [Chlamydoabsidia padenii]
MSNPTETLVTEPVQQDLSGTEQQLEPFYTKLLSLKFTDSATAIKQCRALCAQYGFTVKQEASTHRNIYVYCSREGLPDSQRNPKSNPQRKRPSKRCDCRWRVVLYEREGVWEFRKSLNPEAANHNHDLMRPEEIETPWPKEVIELICELARQRLPTQEIRSRVQSQFTTISWNERRFHNRLSDERQKIRYRDAGQRARYLTGIWTKICMVSAGHEDLADYVEEDLIKLLETVCKSTNTDESTLVIPSLSTSNDVTSTPAAATATATLDDDATTRSNNNSFTGFVDQSPGVNNNNNSQQPRQVSSLKRKAAADSSDKTTNSNSKSEPPKGYINVDIPQHSFMVKIHTRTGSISHASIPPLSIANIDNIESVLRNPRRRRSTLTDTMDSTTTKKTPRKGKGRQSLTTATSPQTASSSSSSSLSSSSLSVTPVHNTSTMGLNSVLGTSSSSLHRLHHHHHSGLMHHRPSSHPLSNITDDSMMHPTPPDTGHSFVYPHFDTQQGGLPLDTTSLSPYVPFHHQNTYNISTGSTSGGFTSDMSFQFDPPSPTPMGGDNESSRSHGNEPTIHPALQSNPMAHHHERHLRKIQPLLPTSTSTAPSGMTIDVSSPSRQFYSMHPMRDVKLGSSSSPYSTPTYSPTSSSPFITTNSSTTDHVLNHTPSNAQEQQQQQQQNRKVSSSSLGN